ncbi:MAG: HU family DNA-binding protein [Clostridia bacterium]|nr:HU family DNA-binding protein [Clostridia bacterium]
MNKTELVKAVAAKAGIAQKDAGVALEAFIDVVTDALKAGDKVAIAKFGTFEVKEKPAREGFNPLTKQPIKIAASKVPVLKFGKGYKDIFN